MSRRNKDWRTSRAIHLRYTTDLTLQEIGERVAEETKRKDSDGDLNPYSASTVNDWVNSDNSHIVTDALERRREHILITSLKELEEQLQAASVRSKEAEKPVQVWTDEDGNLCVQDQHNQYGELVDRYSIPYDFELGPDHKERYYRREEVREILREMRQLVGVDEPDKIQVEHSGEVEQRHALDEETRKKLDGMEFNA